MLSRNGYGRLFSLSAVLLVASVTGLIGCGDEADRSGADATTGDTATDATTGDTATDATTGDTATDTTSDDATDTTLDAAGDADAVSEVDPTDTAAAQAALERVFAALGLDPDSPADLRLVWESPDRFEAYLAAWEADSGVPFDREPASKAECLSLGEFNSTVPYCGPGCGNDVTLAPPCLNRGCFEHDACYAALECRSGEAIDVGLSFSPLTECCDAPLEPARAACAVEVAEGFAAGDLTLPQVQLFMAVSAIMVAVEASPILDSPTDRPPGTCDETYGQACSPGELVVTADPSAAGPGGSVEACGTLTRGGRPVGRWTAVPQTPALGVWSASAAEAAGEEAACLMWTAPADFDGVEGPVELVLEAEVLGESIATDRVEIALESDGVALRPEGDSAIEVGAGEELPICFVAERSGTPFADAEAEFTLAGEGSLSAASGTTDESGRVCVDYTAPAAVPDLVEVVGASVGTAQASVAVTVIDAGPVSLGDLTTERIAGCEGLSDRTAIRVRVTGTDSEPLAGVLVEFLLDDTSIGFAASGAEGIAEVIYDEEDASTRTVVARAGAAEVSQSFLIQNFAGERCEACPGTVVTDDDVAACGEPCSLDDSACLSSRGCQCAFACGDLSFACGCNSEFCACCCGCS